MFKLCLILSIVRRLCLHFLVFIGVYIVPTGAYSQTITFYKERLRDATTAVEFDKAFQAMMTSFHEGKLKFADSDVSDVVGLAQAKPFANTILPSVYGWAGTMYGNGRMHEAIVYFMESAALFARQGKHRAESLCYFQIALVQHKAENYIEAEDFYKKALDTSDSLDHRTRINCYNGLALIKREAGEFGAAEKDFRKAYRIAEHESDSAWIAILLGNIGSVHLRRENLDSALYYYKRNLSIIRKTTEFENEIETYTNLAKVYLGKKNIRNTFSYLDSAVRFINDRKIRFNDFFNPMDEIDRLYALAYAHQGEYKKAFDYYTRFHDVFQSKQDRVNGRSLKQLQLTYSFEQKQNELELLQKVNKANLSTIQQQQYLQYAAVFIIGLLSVLAFVTYKTSRQRKKLNKDLEQINLELERLNRLKNKLFSVISHDLRSPLGNLQAMLGLYQSGNLNVSDVATVTAKLGQQVTASSYVLENLLEWAKSELNESKINPTNVDLRTEADDVLRQFDSDLRAKKITAKNEVTTGIKVWVDRAQMQIVVRNLLANAIKFTREYGTIVIDAKQRSSHVDLMICDNGVGMTVNQLEKLFQADQLATTVGTNKEKGSGIGLLITKELVANNGGVIRVESTKDVGTTFTVTLPCVKTM
jgi:signal transduction histidine kinase